MRKLLLAFVTAALAVTAAPAFGAANEDQAPCFALFASDQPAGQVGESASSAAHEARPLGLNVIRLSTERPCRFEE